MSNTYSGQLDGKVTEQNLSGAFPLLLRTWDFCRLKFPATEVWYSVNNDPRYTATEVDNLREFVRSILAIQSQKACLLREDKNS